jgi:hypothetical protein
MENLGVEEDVRRIAAVLLETALDLDWAREPERVMAWLSQLALELAENRPPRELRLPR